MAVNKKLELQTALTSAMKAKDEDAKRTLRLALSAIKLAEVEARGEITEMQILSILQKEIKTREGTIEEVKKANRDDLIVKAKREIEILNQFLPNQMSVSELKDLAKEIITELDAVDINDMGRVMKDLIPKLQGRASGKDASAIVRELLSNKK